MALLGERIGNGDSYSEHHRGIIRTSMRNLLRHQLELGPGELEAHSDIDLGIIYLLTLQDKEDTAKAIVNNPQALNELRGLQNNH